MEVAACSEAAYKTLPVASAQRMMLFDSEAELLEYISEEQPTWSVDKGVISFNVEDESGTKVPSQELIQNTLAYATELERIV